MLPAVVGSLGFSPLVLASGCMNDYLIHPDRDPAGVETWAEEATPESLQMHLEWAKPPASGPSPR